MMIVYRCSIIILRKITSNAESNILKAIITPNEGYTAILYVSIWFVIRETHTDAADHLNQTTKNLKYLGTSYFGLKTILKK